ncbi:MAG: hypothetical protein ACRC2O_10905 [Chitinophagaceae bacterium]
MHPEIIRHYQVAGLSIQQMDMLFLSFMLIYMNRQESQLDEFLSLDSDAEFMHYRKPVLMSI